MNMDSKLAVTRGYSSTLEQSHLHITLAHHPLRGSDEISLHLSLFIRLTLRTSSEKLILKTAI